jgi:hypothetical protein
MPSTSNSVPQQHVLDMVKDKVSRFASLKIQVFFVHQQEAIDFPIPGTILSTLIHLVPANFSLQFATVSSVISCSHQATFPLEFVFPSQKNRT